jgi:hypothetical protein
MQASAANGFIDRMVRAARLDESVYEEVEHDSSATPQAATVVVVASIAAGVGALAVGGIGALLFGIVAGLLGWLGYAYVAYLIGTRWLAGPDTTADWWELARTLGFANSPRLLLVLGIVPVLGALVALIVGIWVLVTTVVALRAALDFSTSRAIVTAVLAWLVQAVVAALVFAVF